MNKSLIAIAVATIAIAPYAHAEVKISGQVNQAAILDSDLDDVEVVDNNTSGSRFRFVADKSFNGLKAGLRYELQFQDNSSSGRADSLSDADGGEVRISDVWLAGNFGKIAIGKGDGAAEHSFESYGILGHYLAQDLAWLTVNSALDNPIQFRGLDGVGRQNRVRYDSPNFSGFSFAASLDNGDITEISGQYKGKVNGGNLLTRLGITDADEDALSRTTGSIAYKTSFGLGVGYSYGENDADFDTNWLNLTYQIGKTVLSFGTGDDSNDNEQTVIGVNYKPTTGVEIYLNTVDAENADGTEPQATYLGSRIKF